MSQKRVVFVIILAIVMIGITACKKKSPSVSHRYVAPYKPVDIFGKSENFKIGANDGCLTADGKYTKQHDLFNTNIEYYNGWFAGRRNCEGRPAKYRVYTPS